MDVLTKLNVPSGLFKANGIDYLLPPTQKPGIMVNDGAGNLAWGSSPYPNAQDNGDLLRWRRGTSFSSPSGGTVLADAWIWAKVGVGDISVTQQTDVPTIAQSGLALPYSMKFAPLTADTSIAATDVYRVSGRAAGVDLRLLANGMAHSFWIKSSLTGTYCVAYHITDNLTLNQYYIAEITVNNANTWEYKTVVIPAFPTGVIVYSSIGVSLDVNFVLAMGSNFQGVLNAWTSGTLYSTASQVNFMASTSNALFIAASNLVAGSIPLPIQPPMYALAGPTDLPTPTVAAFNDSASPGTGNTLAFSDHRHGMPNHNVPANVHGLGAGIDVMGASAAGRMTDMGSANVVVPNGTRTGTTSVTWATTFPATPKVIANGTDAVPATAELPMMVAVGSVSTTGGTFAAYMFANVAAARTISCTYIGIG